MVVCGQNDYKKCQFSPILEFLMSETNEGNREVKNSICKLCKDGKLTYVGGTNIFKYFFVKRSKYPNGQN